MDEKEKKGGILSAQDEEKQLALSRRKHDRIAIVVVTVLAIVFWLFVRYTQMGIVEHTISGISVEFHNAGELSGATIGGYDTTVTIVVKGSRTVVESLTAENVKAYVDASAVREAGSYALSVEIEGLPEDVTIVSQSVTSLIIYITEGASSTFAGA